MLGAATSISTHKYVNNIKEEFGGAIDNLPQEFDEVSTIGFDLEKKHDEEKKEQNILRVKESIM